jgi:LysR family hydrogen peroxide-inducible transcriptional activator
MNFQQLKYVLAVHKHKHFGMAAESCHITQATLSAMIKKLEEELNIHLFDRSKHPVKTTERGEEFVVIANKILYHENQLMQLNQDQEDLAGTLRIGIIPTVANALLPLILPTLLENNPALKLSVSEITTEDILQQLTMDNIDLGILSTPLENQDFDETILYYEPMMVYGIADSSKNYISSSDVKDKQVWLLEEGHCFRNQAITICEIKEKELESKNLTFAGSSFETLLNLTDKFGGYTLVPELYYKELSPSRKKRTRHFQPPIPVREISIVSYRPYVKNKAVEYLKATIQSIVQGHLTSKDYKNSDLEIIGI